MFNAEDDYDNNYKDIEFLRKEFNKIKAGEQHQSLHEDDFEALIDYFESLGDRENVKLAYEISTSIYPYSTALMMRQAEWFLTQKKTGQALSLIERLSEISPNNMDSLLLHAEILIESNKAKEAADLLEQEINKYPQSDHVMILMELSEVYDELADYEKVYDTLKRVLAIKPEYEDALLRICFWADITKRQKDCIILHEQILDEAPFYASAWYNVGLLNQSLKEYEKAIDAYEYCIAVDTKYEYAYRNQGECYIQLKQFDQAIAVLEEHLQITKPDDIVLETIAYCWERKKQYAKARHFYRKASQLNQEDDTIFYRIGETYAKEKQWEKAIKSYSVALHINKDNVTYCLALGNCLMELEAAEEALIIYLNAVKLRPDIKSTWQALVKGLFRADHLEEALMQLDLAEEHCGDKVDFLYYRAGVLLALGRTKEALHIFELALSIHAKKANVLNHLNKEILQHPVFATAHARYKRK